MRNIREENNAQLAILCENIRIIRKREGLTQKKMAQKLKISVKSLSKLEKGVVPHNLSCEFLINVYLEFGIRPKDIFKRDTLQFA